jgi:hypothetical protein
MLSRARCGGRAGNRIASSERITGVREIGAVVDHLDDERLPRRRVEGIDHALRELQQDHFHHGDLSAEREHRQRQRLQRGQHLRDDEDAMAIPAIGEHARDRREKQHRDLSGETGDAEEQLGVGEAVDQPARGDPRHPRSDERHGLADEEQPIVAVLQCAREAGHRSVDGQSAFRNHGVRTFTDRPHIVTSAAPAKPCSAGMPRLPSVTRAIIPTSCVGYLRFCM